MKNVIFINFTFWFMQTGIMMTAEASNSLFRSHTRKPRILLAACGSVAAFKFGHLCRCFSEWAEVKAVATEAALRFIDRNTIPNDVVLYTEEFDWCTWSKLGDEVVHIELRRWADMIVIAPLSANTLAKVFTRSLVHNI